MDLVALATSPALVAYMGTISVSGGGTLLPEGFRPLSFEELVVRDVREHGQGSLWVWPANKLDVLAAHVSGLCQLADGHSSFQVCSATQSIQLQFLLAFPTLLPLHIDRAAPHAITPLSWRVLASSPTERKLFNALLLQVLSMPITAERSDSVPVSGGE